MNGEDLAARWRRQAELCAGSSPLYERLARAIADDPPVASLLIAARPEQRLGILVFAAVHFLLLADPDDPLARFYPSLGGADTGDPYPAFRDFCLRRQDEIHALVASRATQTNEVNRCSYLMPALAVAARETRGRLAVVEIGASAGLNLRCDRYAYDYGAHGIAGPPDAPVGLRCEVRGDLVPPLPRPMPPIGTRIGIDPAPVRLDDPDAAAWLRACVWPEHTARAERLARAIEEARRDPPELVAADALDALGDVAARIPDDELLCVMHTATLPYLGDEQQVALRELVLDVSRDRPLAWIAAEGEALVARTMGLDVPRGNRYVLALAHVRDGRLDARALAEAGFHGDWIRWVDPATATHP